MKIIDRFENNYAFLSNYYEVPVKYDGIFYQSSEAAYQAQKTKSRADRYQFSALTADESKKLGRKVDIREDWEQIKDNVMLDIVMEKFLQNKELRAQLLATGNARLIEGNWWHDNYWGDCYCDNCRAKKGLNHLGQVLEKVREKLRYV